MTCDALIRPLRSAAVLLLMALSLACNNIPDNLYQGYIEGDYLYVSSPVGGTVMNVPVAKGSRVEEGVLLYELDPEPEASAYEEAQSRLRSARALYEDRTKGMRSSEMAAMEASIEQAEAALNYSKKEYERIKVLYDRQIVAEGKLDAANSAYARDRALVAELRARRETGVMGARSDLIDAARNDVTRAEALVRKTQWALRQKEGFAPSAGLVVDVLYLQGELAPAGRPVAVLLPPSGVKARFFVPELLFSSLSPGQRVQVIIDGRAEPVEASVSYISPEAEYTPPFIYSKDNRRKLVFMVEASFAPEDATGLNPGQPVDVRLSQ